MKKIIDIKEAARLLSSMDNIHIYTHAHPDGDALGSAYALSAILEKTGKCCKAVCLDTLPRYLSHVWDRESKDVPCENIVTVDVADMSLLGEFDMQNRIALAIDHHGTNRVDCENLLCMSHYAATGEIIFDLAKELGVEFDRYIAECLYTAVSTDTGCFKFSNTAEHTFLCVAELTKYAPNGNFGYLNEPLFISKPIEKMKFESEIISSLRFYYDGKLSVSLVTNDIIAKYGLSDSDIGGVEQLGKAPEGVELAITLKERDGGFKISMRSSDRLDCSALCAKFGGGGHHSAAGCFLNGDAESIVNTLIETVKDVI